MVRSELMAAVGGPSYLADVDISFGISPVTVVFWGGLAVVIGVAFWMSRRP